MLTGCDKIKGIFGDDSKSNKEKTEVTGENQKDLNKSGEDLNKSGEDLNKSGGDLTKKEEELKKKELELKEEELRIKEEELQKRKEREYEPPSNRKSNRDYGVPGYYPEGSTRYLTYSDIAGKTKWQLSVMRNEIYARHGYIFRKNVDIKRHFESQSWYVPRYYYVDHLLTDVEKYNIAFIKRYE